MTSTTTYTPSETVLSLARRHRETGEWVPIQDALADNDAPPDLWELSRENVPAAVSCVLAMPQYCTDPRASHIQFTAKDSFVEALRAVCEARESDYCRRLYADLIEPSDPARAEFVRVGCEIEKKGEEWPSADINRRLHLLFDSQDLRRRERELRVTHQLRWLRGIPLPPHMRAGDAVQFKRGLVSSITCTWADWLWIERDVYWHPEQRETCPCADNLIVRRFQAKDGCPTCHGTGTVPRPFPATAQPLEEVRITDVTGSLSSDRNVATDEFRIEDSHIRWPGLRFRFEESQYRHFDANWIYQPNSTR